MKHNIDSVFIDSVIKKDLFKSSLKKTSFIIDEIKKSKDPLLLSFLNQFYNFEKNKINTKNPQQNLLTIVKRVNKKFKDIIFNTTRYL